MTSAFFGPSYKELALAQEAIAPTSASFRVCHGLPMACGSGYAGPRSGPI